MNMCCSCMIQIEGLRLNKYVCFPRLSVICHLIYANKHSMPKLTFSTQDSLGLLIEEEGLQVPSIRYKVSTRLQV